MKIFKFYFLERNNDYCILIEYLQLNVNVVNYSVPTVVSTFQPIQITNYSMPVSSVPSPTTSAYGTESNISEESIARDMELIDHLVREKSEHLSIDTNEWTDVFSPDSSTGFSDHDNESSISSPSSTGSLTPRSESSYASSNYSNDDDWSPPSNRGSSSSYGLSSGSGITKKRTRPYGRSTDDRKYRKKEQNKNAATRYRKKKKAEIEVILVEERALFDENSKLRDKLKDVRQEIGYLKKLMRDLLVAKGIVAV